MNSNDLDKAAKMKEELDAFGRLLESEELEARTKALHAYHRADADARWTGENRFERDFGELVRKKALEVLRDEKVDFYGNAFLALMNLTRDEDWRVLFDAVKRMSSEDFDISVRMTLGACFYENEALEEGSAERKEVVEFFERMIEQTKDEDARKEMAVFLKGF